MKRWLAILISLSLVLGAPLAFAQAAHRDAAAKRAKVEQRMKQIRARMLRKDAGLDDKKATEVEKILDKYEPLLQKLQRDSQTQRRALRALLDKDSNDQAAYEKAVKGLRSAQKKLTDAREKQADELSKILTPKQQAKLLVSIRKLQARLRRRLRAIEDR